ncbi:hypothetical protein IQ277_04930 [Nostocales cyanobacterium LEGE 12452]|nr:hypothetical protein [Nostocales cyanobacterium LEGE 12452]
MITAFAITHVKVKLETFVQIGNAFYFSYNSSGLGLFRLGVNVQQVKAKLE